MPPPVPRVFSVVPGAAFLPAFAAALLDGALVPGFSRSDGPLGLAAATIYVPTRRAARALAESFVAALPGPAVLLPRILPLGQLEATEDLHLFQAGDPAEGLGADLPPAIGDVARRAILTRLILEWGRAVRFAILSVDAAGQRRTDPSESLLVATAPADAWHLSGDLAGLIDELIIEGIDWEAFKPLGLGAFDDYWRITLDFLNIAIKAWPAILAERGVVDGARRQAALIETEIARLAAGGGPVLVAGSTGTNTATARLMGTIARAPRGAVVLPGLDIGLDEASWRLVGGEAGHPQAALHRLLPRLGVTRADVVPIGAAPRPVACRARFLSEALRPAESTDLWRSRAARLADGDVDAGLADVALIEAADERAEALALAVALRETLETPGRTAALLTPDRSLARRVRAELGRWGIEVEDSSGEPLGQVPLGALARLVAACVASRFAPLDALCLLAHPLARFGFSRARLEPIVEGLEIGVLRGAVPRGGLNDPAALVAAAKAAAEDWKAHASRRRIRTPMWGAIERLLGALRAALDPLAAIPGAAPLETWLAAHDSAVRAALRDDDGAIYASDAEASALADLFDGLRDGAAASLTFHAAGYAAFFDKVAGETLVRGPRRAHPRLTILGLLEARLLSPDVAVLGGLDEAIWPPAAQTDAFLNRPMRAELGLSPPERRIGQTAHDFAAALGAPRVVLSRALKRGGSPTVASRFLQRMAALAGEARWNRCRAAGARYLDLARALDRPAAPDRIARPEPRPPVAMRPRELSVTRIEVLRRDPYSIYAERILKLAPLDPLDMAMSTRDFGTGLHAVLGDFTAAFPSGPLPADARERLMQAARQAFGRLADDADFMAFQWPRIARNVDFLLGWEGERRGAVGRILAEASGDLTLTLAGGGTFKLSAVADRIEVGRDGRLTIVDFKTGQPPGTNEVVVGFAPQLTLEAAMARAGAFPGIAAGTPLAGAMYVKLGTGLSGGDKREIEWQGHSFTELVDRHFAGLHELLGAFEREDTPYLPRPFPKFASKFALYDHLARVKEWSATSDETGDDA